MSSIKMSVSDWIEVEDNPIQRDTERHLARAKHLLHPQPTHAFVSAGKLPDGTLIKLDGHTRALAWRRGMVARPPHVEVSIIPIKSREQAKELYKHFDSKDALETATDKISGAFRDLGFHPQSGLLQAGTVGSALRVAWLIVHGYAKENAPRDVYQLVNEFSAEILALDEMELNRKGASGGLICAFILSYRKYDIECLPFWRGVWSNTGTKTEGQMDAIQALCELVLQRKGHYGSASMFDLCARALNAYEKYRNDEMLMAIPRPLNLSNYFEGKTSKKVVALRK